MVIVSGGVINGSGFPLKNSFSLQIKVSSLVGHQPLLFLNKRLPGKIKSRLYFEPERLLHHFPHDECEPALRIQHGVTFISMELLSDKSFDFRFAFSLCSSQRTIGNL